MAHSEDGYHFKVEPHPWVTASTDPYYEIYERYGLEDPRITKIGGNYVMMDRPCGHGRQKGSIWINYSPDLVHWGRAKAILDPEPGWGSDKLGVSTPPIKTEKGWLGLYHGVHQTGSGRLYRIGAVLLALDRPDKVIGYTPHFIFGPEESYERVGDVPNVVFPCGIILEEDSMVKMYYGAADTCITLAEAKLEGITRLCPKGTNSKVNLP